MSDSTPTVLIIDNDEGMVAAISARLESLGYACVTASTGAQGLAVFGSTPIDLVITDLNMPAGDGVTFARTIRRTSDVPIVIVTGFYEEFRTELRTIPHMTLMQKPFDSGQLVELVEADLIMAGHELPVGR